MLALIAAWSLGVIFLLASGENGTDALLPVTTWRLQQRVESAHPLIQHWANKIRQLSTNPVEQAALAEQTVWHGIRYWDETDVWGHHYIPRIEEMVTRAHEKGWETLRGNCISQSIALCSLLRALGLPAQIEANSSHAWVKFFVAGHASMGLRNEDGPGLTQNLPDLSQQPAKIAVAKALGANTQGSFDVFFALPDSNGLAPYFERPGYFLALPIALFFWVWFFREWDRANLRAQAALAPLTRTEPRWTEFSQKLGTRLIRNPQARLRRTIKELVLAA